MKNTLPLSRKCRELSASMTLKELEVDIKVTINEVFWK